MRELIESKGWSHYKTGCSCNGSPKYFNNSNYPGYVVILRQSTFKIQKDNRVIDFGKADKLEQTLIKYELI